jgi:hypothetical protein
LTTEDGNFYLFTSGTNTIAGPIPLPGIPTAFRVFEQLPGMFLLGFEQLAGGFGS